MDSFRRQTWARRDPVGAAVLLWQVRKIAHQEVDNHGILFQKKEHLTLIPRNLSFSHSDDVSDEDADTPRTSETFRCRTVSVCSVDMERAHQISPIHCQDSKNEASPAPSSKKLGIPSLSTKIPTKIPPSPMAVTNVDAITLSHSLVGTDVTGKIRGVLRKKFSWKNYPELEQFLIEHRSQYLEYSSKLNYTSEQKRYNNQLTRGLLDVAKEEGYLFEGFTFAQVRDRIRCYYKSFVQAIKKKKRKKRW